MQRATLKFSRLIENISFLLSITELFFSLVRVCNFNGWTKRNWEIHEIEACGIFKNWIENIWTAWPLPSPIFFSLGNSSFWRSEGNRKIEDFRTPCRNYVKEGIKKLFEMIWRKIMEIFWAPFVKIFIEDMMAKRVLSKFFTKCTVGHIF